MSKPVPWDAWYDSHRWRKRRRAHLMREPLCVMCLRNGRVEPAAIADHIEPHNGNWTAFITGALQSLCKTCYDSQKKVIEARGYSTEIGEDGWPVDPKHPAYRKGLKSSLVLSDGPS
jgi:5-methylcytosine-specific restriction enzyme A